MAPNSRRFDARLPLGRVFPGSLLLIALLLAPISAPLFAQIERGEIRLEVHDSRAKPLMASVEVFCDANQFHLKIRVNSAGAYILRGLPFGLYHLRVSQAGFLPVERFVDVRSEVPLAITVTLGLAPVESRIEVTNSATLLDPGSVATVYAIGSQAIREEQPPQVGRTFSDLVDAQPGWLYEANGVLHPRGSEYDVQYVVNGLPITENRSPAFAPPLESNDVQSMRVMTAGFPAEYGRKLGGVVEMTVPGEMVPGLHFTAESEAGSFDTATGRLGAGYGWGSNQLTLMANAGTTQRYLDPPVLANYTNSGSTGGFSAVYSRDLTNRDRLRLSIQHNQTRYLVPDELVQEQAGQRQDAANAETAGQIDYQRIVSPNLLFSTEGSLRQESFRLWSNPLATPVIISQQRGFKQGYGRVSIAGVQGAHNWKAGGDIFFNPVHEALDYRITNPALFDSGTALQFNFLDHRTDLESAAYVQDELHWHKWNVSMGLRYDYYHFVVDESRLSPRAAIARYFPSAGLLIHFSYDRVFQTPAMENLLLASSPQVSQIGSLVLRLPIRPADANYYEAGFTKALAGKLRLNGNVFRRDFRNFSDDDTLLDTGVSFPIADARAWIQGTEGKLEAPAWGRFSGFVSYANQVAVGQGPITGGLFIGAQAVAGVPDNSRFWISQDQRNTARARLRFQAHKRVWIAAESSYGSGLPVELDTGDSDLAFLLAQYGPRILGAVDFARGRVRPSYSLDASFGFDLYRKERKRLSIQAQASNLTNHLNVLNFASLFSGTAIAVPRSGSVRIAAEF